MLTIAQVAHMTNRHPRWIRSLIHRGYLPAIQRGYRWFIQPSDAARVLAERPRGRGNGPKPRGRERKVVSPW